MDRSDFYESYMDFACQLYRLYTPFQPTNSRPVGGLSVPHAEETGSRSNQSAGSHLAFDSEDFGAGKAPTVQEACFETGVTLCLALGAALIVQLLLASL